MYLDKMYGSNSYVVLEAHPGMIQDTRLLVGLSPTLDRLQEHIVGDDFLETDDHQSGQEGNYLSISYLLYSIELKNYRAYFL